MDLRSAIKEENISSDIFDKQIFNNWLDGAKISDSDYEFIIDKMQENIDNLDDSIDKFYFYDIINKRLNGKDWKLLNYDSYNNEYPREFYLYLKEKKFQYELRCLNKDFINLNIEPLKYDYTEEELASRILEVFDKYKKNEEKIKFNLYCINIFDRVNNKKYIHIKKNYKYEKSNIGSYIMYLIFVNELQKKDVLWFPEYHETFKKIGICSFHEDEYIKVCDNYNLKYNKELNYIYLDDNKYNALIEKNNNYKKLAERLLSPIFKAFKDEFLNQTSLLAYGGKNNEERIKSLGLAINSLFIKNPDWKYRNIDFYIIESSTLPYVFILYENLLCQIVICKDKDENGVFKWNIKLKNDYSYIDEHKKVKFEFDNKTMDIDLSLPNISQSKKASVSNSAMIGGMLFGTTGAIAGASAALEKNAKIDAYNENNKPIIHTVKYKEYSTKFTISSGLDTYYLYYVKRQDSINQLQRLISKINSVGMTYEELFKKLKTSNSFVLEKVTEENKELKMKYEEKNKEYEKYRHSIIGKNAIKKKTLSNELSSLETQISYLTSFLVRNKKS